MGGSEWNNNGKNIIVIHKESKEGDNYDIYMRKIKPRIVGKTGFTTLQYDIIKQKFYNIFGGEREYANFNINETSKDKGLDFTNAVQIDF
jgi:hypothetical protein